MSNDRVTVTSFWMKYWWVSLWPIIAIHSPRWHLTIQRRRPLMFSELYRQGGTRTWVLGPILVSFRRPSN